MQQKNPFLEQSETLFERKKHNCKQPNSLLHVLTDGPNLPTIFQKGYRKKNIQPHLEQEKIQPPRHLAKLSIWRGGLGISDIDTQINYIRRMHLKVINRNNALWKDLMLY